MSEATHAEAEELARAGWVSEGSWRSWLHKDHAPVLAVSTKVALQRTRAHRTTTVQNLLTIWDLLKDGERWIVHSDRKEGALFTYEPSNGEIGLYTLTMNATQGAGWWLRTTRTVRKNLPFDNAKAHAKLWAWEWTEDNRG